jgi:hypothetical protein
MIVVTQRQTSCRVEEDGIARVFIGVYQAFGKITRFRSNNFPNVLIDIS